VEGHDSGCAIAGEHDLHSFGVCEPVSLPRKPEVEPGWECAPCREFVTFVCANARLSAPPRFCTEALPLGRNGSVAQPRVDDGAPFRAHVGKPSIEIIDQLAYQRRLSRCEIAGLAGIARKIKEQR